MKRLSIKLFKWILNKFGYKIAILKVKNDRIDVQGDEDLLKYIDITGYFFKSKPIKRS